MKNNIFIPILVSLIMFSFSVINKAQNNPEFNILKQIPTSPVKNQYRTGTCWAFATTSFIETEAIRKGKGVHDISVMYSVRNAYLTKAKKYVRFHGETNFSEGGQAHDVLNEIEKNGLVPNNVYNGLNYGETIHNHSEMFEMLQGMLNGLINSKYVKPSDAWLNAFNAALDSYLGKPVTEFKYNEKKYTPKKFVEEVLDFNPDDYVELTSFKDYPFYKEFELEIPDNWSHDRYFNLPLTELIDVINNALNNGYSVNWDGDVSEEDFDHKEGSAVLSLKESDGIIMTGIDKMRLKSFNNFTTTDDHLMHITGIAKDKNGTIFYLTKNSWGENSNNFGGYLYMSQWYVQLKTIAIMVHKDAIPKTIRKKLGF
ncbi:MAG: aminopeptidase [Bacteroidales bacterium]|nr:aminopeptidase [Bacteroidales bacterium]MBN2758779.1 aminopeptidase [Bacteroidales bacterium]